MATYNKRGYKAPKPAPAEVNEVETAEPVVDESNSTTAGVFNTLDEKATQTEEWVARNQKWIYGVVGAVALAAILYVLYDRFIHEPAENTAANDMYQAQEYFQQAVDAPVANDSLYNLALNGGEGKMGFIGIIEEHGGTDAANLAHYYAGMAYLNTGKYKEGVEHLSEFNTKDEILNALSLGAIGDAFTQLGQNEDALEYYNKAINAADNDVTTPRFLFKAGQLALTMNKKEEALKHFNQIKEKYDASPQGVNIEAYIARAQ